MYTLWENCKCSTGCANLALCSKVLKLILILHSYLLSGILKGHLFTFFFFFSKIVLPFRRQNFMLSGAPFSESVISILHWYWTERLCKSPTCLQHKNLGVNKTGKPAFFSCYRQPYSCTRVGTLIVATIYLQLIQNGYMFRSFTVIQFSHQHCVQPVASDVEVVGYL